MQITSRFLSFALLISSVAAVSAGCGGGGGGEISVSLEPQTELAPATPQEEQLLNTNDGVVPVIVNELRTSVIEGASGYFLTLLVQDDLLVSFSIVDSLDARLFQIRDDNKLSFRLGPDFEAPEDYNLDNKYEVSIRASNGSQADVEVIEVTVTDALEGRVISSYNYESNFRVDLNNDNQNDANEPKGTTDEQGYFKLEQILPELGDVRSAKIIVWGGRPNVAGDPFQNYVLTSFWPTSASETTMVSPLTTLLSAVEGADARLALLHSLDIDQTVDDVLTTDSLAQSQKGITNAQHIERVNQKIALILKAGALMVNGQQVQSQSDSEAFTNILAKEIVTTSDNQNWLTSLADSEIHHIFDKALLNSNKPNLLSSIAVGEISRLLSDAGDLISESQVDPNGTVIAQLILMVLEAISDALPFLVADTIAQGEFSKANNIESILLDIIALGAIDSDGDRIPDDLDPDDDNDSVEDSIDYFPLNPTETLDSDLDGMGNNEDLDDDNDGVLDIDDPYPLSQTDTPDSVEEETPESLPEPPAVSTYNPFLDSDGDGLQDDVEEYLGKTPNVAEYKLKNYFAHSCALHDAGVNCWGLNDQGQTDVPILRGKILDIDVGYHHSCVIHGDEQAIKCWGDMFSPNGVDYFEISSGADHVCGITTSGKINCFGANGFGQTSVPPLEHSAIQVVAGSRHTCALTLPSISNPANVTRSSLMAMDEATTQVTCWGKSDERQIEVPEFDSPPVFLAAGSDHNCALTMNNSVICWGRNNALQSEPPANFSQLEESERGELTPTPFTLGLGRNHSCLLSSDGNVVCWGSAPLFEDVPAVSKPIQIAPGMYNTCLLHGSGVSCWGINYEQANDISRDLVFNDFDGDGVPDIGDSSPIGEP